MIDEPDNVLAWWALLMWRNVLQTGDPHLSTVDAKNTGQLKKVRQLSSEQQEFVVRLEHLAESFRKKAV